MPWNRFNPTFSTTRNVLRPGISGQTCAGRQLTVADFTSMGLSQPAGLFNLSSTTNLGTGGNLTNKGSVAFTGTGIEGTANTAAVLTGSTAQTLYAADTGASDPFRIRYGSWGCWFKTGKGANNPLLYKYSGSLRSFGMGLGGQAQGVVFTDVNYTGTISSDLTIRSSTAGFHDNNWHFAVGTWDGTNLCLYVDGRLEGWRQSTGQNPSTSGGGPLSVGANPLNIGSWAGDASTTAGETFTGLLEEAFITADVLSEDQIRNLYAVKISHGLPTTPKSATTSIRRLRIGAALATSDFSTAPLRLYNFTGGALTDAGTNGQTLTNNNTATVAVRPDGTSSGAYHFKQPQYLSATDTGLPSGTSNSTIGCWFKTNAYSGYTAQHLITYGLGGGTNRRTLYIGSTGLLITYDGSVNLATPQTVADFGSWHFAAWVTESSAADGYRQKLYMDGELMATSTSTVNTTTLAGANGLKLGTHPNGSTEYFFGAMTSVFITDYAMPPEHLMKLYAKGSQSLGISVKNAGDHIEQITSTHAYVIADNIAPQNQIDIDLRT